MKKTNLLLIILTLLFVPLASCTGQEDLGPTAIVIDAENGRPIKGAIALAQWHKSASLGLGMGGTLNLVKASEVSSDKRGHIFIDDFWISKGFNWKSRRQPRLTVYKPGYVLWDSEWICPIFEKRTDFDEQHRTVKLLKFDTEAARWLKKGYDVGRGGPHVMQDLFFSHCYSSEVPNQIKFEKIFYQQELPFIEKERMEKYKKLYGE